MRRIIFVLLLAIICAILGIIFSSNALKRIKQEPETRKGKGLARAGLIIGIIVTASWLVFIVWFAILYNS